MELVVAVDSSGGIGKDGLFPWPTIAEDLAFFKRLTIGHIVVMGRKTWNSLPVKPLINRINIVVTSDKSQVNENDTIFTTIENLSSLLSSYKERRIFIIGGTKLYEQYLPIAETIHMTLIEREYNSDVYFPFDAGMSAFSLNTCSDQLTTTDGTKYRHLLYKRNNSANKFLYPSMHPEFQYLNLLNHIATSGCVRPDRTGVGTHSIFGTQMRFDISGDTVPILTTKKVPWKSCIRELLFFLCGTIDTTVLESQGVNIWKGNTSRDFLDKRGLSAYPTGCMGPAYSWQWRSFGAPFDPSNPYVSVEERCQNGGIDQIANILHLLKTDPFSRRILLSAWNPQQLDQMALPPCHMLAQFYVNEEGGQKHLSCQMYQRSVDTACGLPWNMLSYALLTKILALKSGMQAKELILVGGDAHVYSNHLEGVQEQISRMPRPWPKMTIDPSVIDMPFEEIKVSHFQLIGYLSHSAIKFEMAI
jgi:dihydrofolate reductase/thymidylate synthase